MTRSTLKNRVYYKCSYKPTTYSKEFKFRAEDDRKAIQIASEEMKRKNIDKFSVDKITTERLI